VLLLLGVGSRRGGVSQAATESGPGAPPPERAAADWLVVVSIHGCGNILCPLTWVSQFDRTFQTAGVSHGSNGSGPPSEDYILSREGLVGTGTGPANSAAMDLGSPAATTLGLTNVVSKRRSEVATGDVIRIYVVRPTRLRHSIVRRHDTKVKLNSSFFTYYNTTAMVPSNQHSIDNQQSTATVPQHLWYPATNGKVLSATNNRQLTRQSAIETRSDGDLSLPKNCTVYAKSYGNRIKKFSTWSLVLGGCTEAVL